MVLDVKSIVHDAISILCFKFMSGLATPLQCNFTFNTHLFANIVAVNEAASSQELLAHLFNTMDQQHNTSQQ